MEFVIDYLKEHCPQAIVFDNCNDAIVGTAKIVREGDFVEVALYDKELLIEHFRNDFSSVPDDDEDTDYELQAIEWVEYNIEGAYLGKYTPVILR